MKKQEANGLLSQLMIKTPLSEIALLVDIWFWKSILTISDNLIKKMGR